MQKQKIKNWKKILWKRNRIGKACWEIAKRFGLDYERRYLARGKISKRPYEIDILATKKLYLGLVTKHLWVECKAYRVKRRHVTKLVESARDVRDAYEDDIESWKPDMLMLVSNIGFDVDAIGLANKYGIYCVEAKKTFKFVGEMSREHFEDCEGSEY